MMSGFVIWHVIGHQRRFATYRAQQHDKVWKRLAQRPPLEMPVGILGYGAIGARVAADLALLGFPIKVWSRSAKPVPAGITSFHGRDGLSALLPDTEILVNLLPLTAETRGILNRDVRLMFDYLHGDIVKQLSPTNFDDAGSRFNAFAMRTQVTF